MSSIYLKQSFSSGCISRLTCRYAKSLAIFLQLSVISLALLLSSATQVQGDTLNKGIYSPQSKPFGVDYKDWTAEWWQWNMGIPKALHPRDNYSAEKCSIHQEGPVWFLPDSLTGKEDRTCSIPFGKAILVPLLPEIVMQIVPALHNQKPTCLSAQVKEHKVVSFLQALTEYQ